MLKIYGVPISVHTRKVIVVALAKGLAHEVIPVVPVIPGNPPANWRELSPTGKIPALTRWRFHRGGLGSDLRAISRRFIRRSRCIHLHRATTPRRCRSSSTRARCFATWCIRCSTKPLSSRGSSKVATNQKRIDKVLAGAVAGNVRVSRCRDSRRLSSRATAPTVADFAVVSNLITYQYIGFDLLSRSLPPPRRVVRSCACATPRWPKRCAASSPSSTPWR